MLEELHSIPRVDPAASSLSTDCQPYSLFSSDLLLLRYELEMRLDSRLRSKKAASIMGIPQPMSATRSIISRLERQTMVFLDFIMAHATLPFLESFGNRMHNSANLYRYRRIVLELEQHVDCLIIWDHWEDEISDAATKKEAEDDGWNEQLLEMLFYAVKKQKDL